MPLSDADQEVVQAATLELHEMRELDGLREATPRIFRRAIPSDYFCWFESARGRVEDFELPENRWESPRRLDTRVIVRMASLMDQHPFTRHALETGDLGPLRLSDFWTRREQLRSEIHREVWRHVGIGRLLAIAVVRGRRGGMITLSRPLSDRDFSERDRNVLRLLVPHFVQALAAAELSTARRSAMSDVLASLGLTPRETEVATWLARGRTNPEIASILGMKPRTVEKHVESLLVKLGAENRTAAARVVLGLATVGPPSGTRPASDKARQSVLQLMAAPRPGRLRTRSRRPA